MELLIAFGLGCGAGYVFRFWWEGLADKEAERVYRDQMRQRQEDRERERETELVNFAVERAVSAERERVAKEAAEAAKQAAKDAAEREHADNFQLRCREFYGSLRESFPDLAMLDATERCMVLKLELPDGGLVSVGAHSNENPKTGELKWIACASFSVEYETVIESRLPPAIVAAWIARRIEKARLHEREEPEPKRQTLLCGFGTDD